MVHVHVYKNLYVFKREQIDIYLFKICILFRNLIISFYQLLNYTFLNETL